MYLHPGEHLHTLTHSMCVQPGLQIYNTTIEEKKRLGARFTKQGKLAWDPIKEQMRVESSAGDLLTKSKLNITQKLIFNMTKAIYQEQRKF